MKLHLLFLLTFFIWYVNADYFEILEKEYKQTVTGKVRRFYITAEEEIWDYTSQINSNGKVPDRNKFGSKYYKAIYHEYDDINYANKKTKPSWQGNMGPILKAEVGDIIQIFFWNKASKNFTIHPHGVFYEFEMEGAVFEGSFEDSIVLPNHNYTYTWNVLPRTGPGPEDGNSIVWGYHSHVNENDIYAGLYGAILVYKPGTLSNDDIVTSIFVSDEAQSPYFVKTKTELYPPSKNSDHEFYCINGLISSSPKDLVIKNQADWHVLGWGTYKDVKYITWENSEIELFDVLVDSVRIMPASFYTATIRPNSKSGRFKFGALDYEKDGMTMIYNVAN